MENVDFQLIEKKEEARFVIRNVPPQYHLIMNKLAYASHGDSFYRSFPGKHENLKLIFSNLQSNFSEILKQQAEEVHLPWEKALERLLSLLEEEDIHWWILGTGALCIRGIDIVPHDFDLVTDREGAYKLAQILENYLVEPLIETDWIARYFCRAFLDFRIEWVGEVNDDDTWVSNNYGIPVEKNLETVDWNGHSILAAPINLLLEQSKERGLDHRVYLIEKYLQD